GWEQHARYGRQFRVASAIPIVPATPDGVIRYLASGRFPGIGAEMARRIVARLGPGALELLEREPGRLLEVPGIGKKRARALRAVLEERRIAREVLVFLGGLGLSAATAARIVRRYGDQAIQLVRQNPYRLAREVAGIGFGGADAIARALGFRADAPER